jgi:hypothetical protein
VTTEWIYGRPYTTDATNFEWALGLPYIITEKGGWANIAKINGVAAADMAKVNGIAIADIAKVNGVAV